MTRKHLVALTSSLLSLGLTGPSFAQEACGQASCPENYECVVETEACVPCPADECPPCEAVERFVCEPLPCTSDADCGADMRCAVEQVTVCSDDSPPCADPGVDGGGACPPSEPAECRTETLSACLPVYSLPCTQASDCGDGFTCDPVEDCSCSGSGGSAGRPTPAADAGAEPGADPAPGEEFVPADGGGAPEPPDCTCTPTGENACRVIPTECAAETATSDCPSGWACRENPEGSCWSGPEDAGCAPADPPMLCVPPYSDLGDVDRGGGEDTGSGLPLADGGASPPPAGTGGGTGAGADPEGGTREAGSVERGGCSLGRARGGAGPLLGATLVIAALALARRRRR